MKTEITLFNIVLICFLHISTLSFSQAIQGKATYVAKSKNTMKLDEKKFDKETIKKTKSFFDVAFTQHFELTFNPNESIYKKVPQKKISKKMSSQIVTDKLYKNLGNKIYKHQKEFLNKRFIIIDSLVSGDWKISSSTKKIGKYTCYKAEMNLKRKKVFKGEIIQEVIKIIAWYTPEIPVNNGPELYSGLPGLILEINDGKKTILCTSVSINSKNKIKIKTPIKGKKVTQEEFLKVQKKKYGQKEKDLEFRKGYEGSKN